jgi:hypothetical protein
VHLYLYPYLYLCRLLYVATYQWRVLHDISKMYRGAGIQTFTHSSHASYACQGPYIKDWEKGAAAWHPSVVAHKLRAAHHAYFWLVGWRDAIAELLTLATHRPIDGMIKDVQKHISSFHRALPPPIHPSPMVDDMQCFSDYEPRSVAEASLKSLVVSGLAADNDKGKGMLCYAMLCYAMLCYAMLCYAMLCYAMLCYAMLCFALLWSAIVARGWFKHVSCIVGVFSPQEWKSVIYENLVNENMVKQSLKMGYRDFKHLLYADKNSGPLSLSIRANKEGPLFACETPGIWGALPEGFKHLWESNPAFQITYHVADTKAFKFDPAQAQVLEYKHTNELEICVQVVALSIEMLPPQLLSHSLTRINLL